MKEEYEGQSQGLMIRCPKCKKENWAMAVAKNRCAWCGFDGGKHATKRTI